MPAAKEKISFQLVARFMALLLLLAATAASAQARSAAENRVWKKSASITESLLSQPLQLLELHQVKAPLGWYDASGDTFAAEGEAAAPKYGSTPEGRPLTKHYGTETGPERNIPGSVVDNTINTTPGVPGRNGTTVHYDPANNVTVVTGNGGSIVSVHKGAP